MKLKKVNNKQYDIYNWSNKENGWKRMTRI